MEKYVRKTYDLWMNWDNLFTIDYSAHVFGVLSCWEDELWWYQKIDKKKKNQPWKVLENLDKCNCCLFR